MPLLILLVGCETYTLHTGMCEWEQVAFSEDTWAGQTPEQWAEPYLGSWTIEPTWTSEDLRPPVGVGELFQIDLALSSEPAMVKQIAVGGSCDPTPTLRVPVTGSLQSLDGNIQAVHSGSEQDWVVQVREDGEDGVALLSQTESGSLAWSGLFEGEGDGANHRFHLWAHDGGGSLAMDVTRENSARMVWSDGTWSW
ncbi:MAG: hypothetical protein VX899_14615 [Myxococcota bacterium]|nr:hypothetical protein [Myxococcota bacterium]